MINSHSTPQSAANLLIAGAEADVTRLTEILVEDSYLVTAAGDGVQTVQCGRTGEFAAALVQLPVADWSAEELLEELQRACRATPVIFLASEEESASDFASAVRLIKLGAFQYLPYDSSQEDIASTIRSAVQHGRMSQSASPPSQDSAAESWRRFLVGESAALGQVTQTVRLIGNRRCTVLITGETGTGKEMAARAIHAAGPRSVVPMVAINCSALPENLLEAELFGHVKGAFTGAFQNRTGRFEQAHRGTIFLDEIGDMPMELQAKLLRVLQEREFQRLGSSETVKVDVRVIAASNVDLSELVRQGRFREDLYYRINVVPLQIPALRERASDIPMLTQHFIEKVCRQEEIPAKQAAPETLSRLCRYLWPGNVRQLENAVEMAIALSGTRPVLYPGDFPLPSVLESKRAGVPSAPHVSVPDEGLDFEQIVGRLELSLLEQALRKSHGNKKLAADLLGLKRTTLAAKLKSLGATASPAAV